MTARTDRKKLIESLVGDRHELYLRNVAFRHAVDLLVEMLPAMVNGLAEAAAENQARAEQLKEQLERAARDSICGR